MSHDPMDAATNAGESAGILYGKLDVSAQFVALAKGMKKHTFIDGQDNVDDRRTEVHIVCNLIDALIRSGAKGFVERLVIAESAEWSRGVWASARALGVSHARELHGKWCKCQMVPSGRKWMTSAGEEVTGTTFKFLALYANETECLAHFAKDRPTGDEESEISSAFGANGSDKERDTALQFLPPLIKAANGDMQMLATAIASMPLISKYFTVDSPEVQELLKAA